MKLKKCILTILFLLSIFLLWNSFVYAGDLELRDLKYDVTLNSDGTANVTETWNIAIEDTNTLFKTFEIDSSKYSGIKNVSLTEITNNKNKEFTQIYTEKYHVDKNCFYALVNSKNQFEIAWGVHEDDSYARRTFKMSYTIIDAIKNYSDCSEFYWQFISTESAIPARQVTGTIKLPTNVLVDEDFRVWAHGPLYGNILKASNNTVNFEVESLKSETMLEARVVTPTYVFANNKNISSENKLASILSQEQIWADEANAKRKTYESMQKIMKIATILFFIVTNIAGIILAIVLIKKVKKYKKDLEEAPNYTPTMPSKYYRDMPNEITTPAQAGFLYYFKNSNLDSHIPDAISSTILDLCMKKYLEFEVSAEKKNNIKIILKPDMDKNLLPKDEKVIYEMFEKVSSNNEFTMKDFEKYAKNHSSSFLAKYNSIPTHAKEELENQGSYSKTLIKAYSNWSVKGVGFIFLFISSCIFMIANIIPSIICAIYCFRISSRYNTLTQKGVDEKEAWIGLKNYMEDFSMMDQKEVPELVLWEKYLVYATAFGIADTVLKQLKVVYPQITDMEYMNSHGYTYLYYMSYGNFTNNFIHSINTSVTNTYNSINYSSGSGSGGGFSGGGGFGGGGGRNGRKIKYLLYFYKICDIIEIIYKGGIYYDCIFNYISYYSFNCYICY